MIAVESSSVRPITNPAPRMAPTTADGSKAYTTLTSSLGAFGTVTFSGREGDSGEGWSVGFMQSLYVEENWAIFRGGTPEKGSILVQNGAPPVLPVAACRDSDSGSSPFYSKLDDDSPPGPGALSLPKKPRFPLKMGLVHWDSPHGTWQLALMNQRTNMINLLHESATTYRFATVLAVRGPGGLLKMLRGFYWRCAWHDHFDWPSHGAPLTILPSNRADNTVLGGSFVGPPTDPQLLSVLTTPQPQSCTQLLNSGKYALGARYRDDWAPFDTTR